jgi:UDP-N-acetylmuramoyl-tripeptide--D-alanyl-D-alanine ligase
MDVLWTADAIAAVTNGKRVGSNFEATGVSIDSRTLQRGDLFIAIQGQHSDGHIYINAALEKGASGIIATSTMQEFNGVVVTDTLRALQDLGAGARARSQAHLFGITGSVGKTSAKEMLARCLRLLDETHAAEASLNNHWGVPLSLARMPITARYGVFELGMNHANEIAPLSKMIAPHCALITTIASAHIANLGSLENIARAKAEIFQGMDTNGVAVLPRDSEQYAVLLAEARTCGLQNIITFGRHSESDFRVIDITTQGTKTNLSFTHRNRTYQVTLGLAGDHQAMNACGVLACVSTVCPDIEQVFAALETMQPVMGRGNRWSFTLQADAPPVIVIDETHNASPIAVRAALEVVAKIPTAGRRIAILGDMLELGDSSPREHAALKDAIEAAAIDQVWTCGKWMIHLAEAMPFGRSRHYEDSASLASQIEELICPGDVLLVKGSRGSAMKRVIDVLQMISHSRVQAYLEPSGT